jgi:hypothetical protein
MIPTLAPYLIRDDSESEVGSGAAFGCNYCTFKTTPETSPGTPRRRSPVSYRHHPFRCRGQRSPKIQRRHSRPRSPHRLRWRRESPPNLMTDTIEIWLRLRVKSVQVTHVAMAKPDSFGLKQALILINHSHHTNRLSHWDHLPSVLETARDLRLSQLSPVSLVVQPGQVGIIRVTGPTDGFPLCPHGITRFFSGANNCECITT